MLVARTRKKNDPDVITVIVGSREAAAALDSTVQGLGPICDPAIMMARLGLQVTELEQGHAAAAAAAAPGPGPGLTTRKPTVTAAGPWSQPEPGSHCQVITEMY